MSKYFRNNNDILFKDILEIIKYAKEGRLTTKELQLALNNANFDRKKDFNKICIINDRLEKAGFILKINY